MCLCTHAHVCCQRAEEVIRSSGNGVSGICWVALHECQKLKRDPQRTRQVLLTPELFLHSLFVNLSILQKHTHFGL